MQRFVGALAATMLTAGAITPALAASPVAVTAPIGDDAGARAAVASLPRATAVNDADGDKLFDDLEQLLVTAPERLPVIVTLTSGTRTADGVLRTRQVAPTARITQGFRIIPAFAAELTATEAARVAALPEVRQIEHDTTGTPELRTATAISGADVVVDALGFDGSADGDPTVATTDDVVIAVLDSGIDVRHPDLAGKVVGWKDFGNHTAAPYDTNGHGTHVASIAAGWGRDGDHRGVAPGAALVGIRIDGGSTESNAIAGYQYVVEHREALGIRVATMSYGFGTATDGTTALELAVDRAWDAGIVTFKSTGNGGPAHGTMTVPAAARGILAIGSMLDPFGANGSGGFRLSSYSSRGPTSDGRIKPDLVAPGESISAARVGGGYTEKSGTSMASPFAAGVAALMIDAVPSLTPDEIRTLMFATAEDRGVAGPDNDFGHGRVQAREAVLAALAAHELPAPPSDPVVVPARRTIEAVATTGVFETTVTVPDGTFPFAGSVLGDRPVLAVEVIHEPSGGISAHHGTAQRQVNFAWYQGRPGTYTLRVVTVPTARLVLDLSNAAPD